MPLCRCILSKFYIKPQPCLAPLSRGRRCILSKFYIKPQLGRWCECHHVVVSYRNSTSNHNTDALWASSHSVVSYRNSTSNHNVRTRISCISGLYLIEILHQTTTGRLAGLQQAQLYLIEILHQTTTGWSTSWLMSGCILSKFYIKPQPATPHPTSFISCILSKFYIKPQRRASY